MYDSIVYHPRRFFSSIGIRPQRADRRAACGGRRSLSAAHGPARDPSLFARRVGEETFFDSERVCAPHSFFSSCRKERTRRARCKKEKGAPVSHAFLRSAVRGKASLRSRRCPGKETGKRKTSAPARGPGLPSSEYSGRPEAAPCDCHPERSRRIFL